MSVPHNPHAPVLKGHWIILVLPFIVLMVILFLALLRAPFTDRAPEQSALRTADGMLPSADP